MNRMTQSINLRSRPAQSGVSLIELMIALLIGSLIALGLVQIFGASSATSKMTEGLSRVQENGRFASQFLQRQLRMVGFMGCGSDTGRMVQQSFVNHLSNFDATVSPPSQFRFQRPVEAYTVGTMTAPTELATITNMVSGSDALILRVFSEESTPVISTSQTASTLNILIGKPDAAFLPDAGDKVLFGLQNCRSADVFAGALNGTVPGSMVVVDGSTSPNIYLDPSVSSCGTAPCPWDFRISNAFLTAKPLVGEESLNAEIHRAEYFAMFIRPSATTGIPGLHLVRFERDSTALAAPEEFIEGVENMQLRFGYDTTAIADGAIDEYKTAAEVIAGAATDLAKDDRWRRVMSVRVALLIRSPDRAGAPDRTFRLIDVDVTPAANDGAIREVYETTIALRNRLFNS